MTETSRGAPAIRSQRAEPAGGTAASGFRVTCWGTRGSIPSPGNDTEGFGGNTSCLEVRCGSRLLILDAGTGIRLLSHRLSAGPPVRADLLITHFHPDHVQGFPFFEPLYDARAVLRIRGPAPDPGRLRSRLLRTMARGYFPVQPDAITASIDFEPAGARSRIGDGIEIAAMRMRHSPRTAGYRIRWRGRSVGYLPDNEIGEVGERPAGWYAGLVEFLRGTDLLFHDAMYTDAEYRERRGWGHSTQRQAIRLAEDAGVARLQLFHHDPDRTDAEIRSIVEELRHELAERGSPLLLEAAAETAEIDVGSTSPAARESDAGSQTA